MFSMLASIPTAERTTSHSIFSSPFAVLTVTTHPFPEVSTDSTEELVLILNFQRDLYTGCVLKTIPLPDF